MNLTEEAKKYLKEKGYFTDSLWHIDDVQNHFKCNDDTAQEVLEAALTNDWITEQINTIIGEQSKILNLKEINEDSN